MKIGTVTLLAFLGLIAVGSAAELENENGRNLVTDVEEEVPLEEEAPMDEEMIEDEEGRELHTLSKYERKKIRQQMKKKRQERKRLKKLRRQEKKKMKQMKYDKYYHSHHQPHHYTPHHPTTTTTEKPYYHGTCELTACITTYPKDRRNLSWHWGWTTPPPTTTSWTTPPPSPPDVHGKVLMTFEKAGGHWSGAPPFYWYFDLDGLIPESEGVVHLLEDESCEAINPADPDEGFYNWMYMHNNPWTDSIKYDANWKGEAEGKYRLNNGWPCEAAVGKAVFVEIPGESGYYGCGIMKKGYDSCKPKKPHYWW